MSLSKISHLPLAAFLAALIICGMPALAKLQPKPAADAWLCLRPPLFPVAGTVLYEGQPVVGATVTFMAQEHAPEREYLAVSSTDQTGRFWLRTFSSQGDGAVAGTHLVKVERMVPTGRMVMGPGMASILDIGSIPPWFEALFQAGAAPGGMPSECGMYDSSMGIQVFPGMPEMINALPARFADETTSGLLAEVTREGPNEFLIQLRAEPPAEAAEEAGAVVAEETSVE